MWGLPKVSWGTRSYKSCKFSMLKFYYLLVYFSARSNVHCSTSTFFYSISLVSACINIDRFLFVSSYRYNLYLYFARERPVVSYYRLNPRDQWTCYLADQEVFTINSCSAFTAPSSDTSPLEQLMTF